MEIKFCPVLHPTEEQFSDFYKYVHFLDKNYKQDYGMVKIVPPPQWKPQAKNYQQRLEKLCVKNAIQQNVQGGGGFYECRNIIQDKMTFKAYRKYAEKQSLKVADKSLTEKEKLFWKTISYSPPVYGADLTGSLMDEKAGEWNLNSLNSLLRYALTERVKGVTEPYCYIGSWKAFFSWHKEDLDLSSLNYIHQGAPKIWYCIAKDNSHILEGEAREHFRSYALNCSEFLRHKTFLINPETLLQRHKDLKITKIEHKAGEIMMVFGGAYHTGFNSGFNIAEAVNYATTDWLGDLINVRFCKCSRKGVRGEIQSILYNLENSQLYDEISKLEVFQALQAHVLEQQQLEEIHLAATKEGTIIHSEPTKTEEREAIEKQDQQIDNVAKGGDSEIEDSSKDKTKRPTSLKIKKSKKDAKRNKKVITGKQKSEKQAIKSKDLKQNIEEMTQNEKKSHNQNDYIALEAIIDVVENVQRDSSDV